MANDCSCIKNVYDIHIGHRGCRKIVYQDMSVWMSGDGYEVPESYDVEVLVPGRSDFSTLTVKTGINNIITTKELFEYEEEICLEDGIYCFKTNSCGVQYEINRAYLCTLECKLQQLIAKAKTNEDFKEIIDIRHYLDAIKINARLGKPEKAKDFFKIVDSKLKHLTCSC